MTIIERPKNNYEPYIVLDDGQQQPADCKYNCIPGCFCKKPLYRNRFGECVEEEQCRKNFNRNDFVDELNKFLNFNQFNDAQNSQEFSKYRTTTQRQAPNQKYIAVNDNSESIIDSRTGYLPKRTGYQTNNDQSFFNLEKDFFNNFFDDIFNQYTPKQQQTYQAANDGNINVNNNALEKQIEKEADIIMHQINNGLK